MTTINAKLAYAPRKFDALRVAVELGHEPAIQIGGARTEGRDRRRAPPLRWLIGVALTGLSGVALIGSTLYLDLDRKSNFAEAPEFVAAQRHEAAGGEAVNPGKGDRLVRPINVVAAKQAFKSTMTMKVGDKEVLRDRPYTLLSMALVTAPTTFAEAVPAFNPLKLSNAGNSKADVGQDLEPPTDDSEAGFVSRDLASADLALVRGELSLGEAQSQVSQWVKSQSAGERLPALAPQMLLMRTSRAGIDPLGALTYATVGAVEANAPFASVEVRMVPENVTNIPRAGATETEASATRQRLAQLRHGESFESLLRANGASAEGAAAILAAFGVKKGESPVAEGQKIILEYEDAPGGLRRIARISIYADDELKATVAMDDNGDYAPTKLAQTPPYRQKRQAESEDDDNGMSLYQSVYESGLKQGLPKPIIDEFVRAFINDVDFQRSVQPGDSLVAFMNDADEIDLHPALLYASLTVRDQTYRYYRFQTPDDNGVDYYDDNGRSGRKFLLRKPIAAGEMTSPFGMRYHPILHISRLHSGVDWGAPVGTPILAAGNGVVIKAAYDSGYGRRVEIQHANGYVTTYNHMSAFGRGIVEGVRVTQGQIVGYLGQSGLATGPHLHYEVIINGNFVDPMAIKLARTREFDGRLLALFHKERDRIDGLMAQAPNASAASPARPSGRSAGVN